MLNVGQGIQVQEVRVLSAPDDVRRDVTDDKISADPSDALEPLQLLQSGDADVDVLANHLKRRKRVQVDDAFVTTSAVDDQPANDTLDPGSVVCVRLRVDGDCAVLRLSIAVTEACWRKVFRNDA